MAKKSDIQVAVIMGSTSDLRVMKPAVDLLKEWKVKTEIQIVSAHRTPDFMKQYAETAPAKGVQVIIAGAGGAAHLPGMMASFTSLPVIGVPVSTKSMKGLDSLLSIVQMPRGVPLACVAIDNAFNAALLALRILALGQPALQKKLKQFQKKQRTKTLQSNKSVKALLKKLS